MDEVLVVGAGPTGLTLAAELHAQGAAPRVVERRPASDPGTSHAFVVHPRTLELLARLGLAAPLLARGDASARVEVRAGRRRSEVGLTHAGLTDTAYPHLLTIPQSAVEEVLREHLARVGIDVEHGVEFLRLWQRADGVDHELRRPGGRHEEGAARYVVGCDGADSTVRRTAGIPFWVRPYRQTILLADVEVDGGVDVGRLHGFVHRSGVLFVFPSPGTTPWRLLFVRPGRGRRAAPDVHAGSDLPALQAVVDDVTGGALRLRAVSWTKDVALRRGQARNYRHGRVLVAGDAAHLHSPAGAQGMNTGIHDACNLGWKLALVVAGAASPVLLDSYATERWPVARRTRQLTDLAFRLEAGDDPLVRWLRAHVAPMLLPMVRDRTAPTPGFRLLAGLLTRYRHSPIVAEGEPRLRRGPHAGDRLPDGRVATTLRSGWLHEHLDAAHHHLLLCGPPGRFDGADLDRLRTTSPLPLRVHRLAPTARGDALLDVDGRLLRRLGIVDAGVYLVRPDGYVALRSRGASLAAVRRYLDGWPVAARSAAAVPR